MKIQSRKLLIIDDDNLVRQSLVAYLEDSGYDISQAVDGTQGLAMLGSVNPDLVLTDLRMQGMDGLTVLKEVTQREPDIPVIVISGVGVMGDVVEALRLGASDYLTKPIVDMEVLVHSIERALERRDLLAQNRKVQDELERTNRELQENLRTLERDHRAGRMIQERMLPSGPMSRDGYRINHQVVPSLFLSGDFVDYAFLGERYLAFYLTDVSGHGASSAFVTVWLKHMVTRMVRENGFFSDETTFAEGPNWMLQQINSALLSARLNHHFTCFLGVIDTQTDDMRYVVGGHLPMPILLTENGAKYLSGKGKPVGIFQNPDWTVYQATLPPDSQVVAFSDGVLEILPGDGLEEKETALLRLVEENGSRLSSISEALGLKSLVDVPDDIAMLTIANRGN